MFRTGLVFFFAVLVLLVGMNAGRDLFVYHDLYVTQNNPNITEDFYVLYSFGNDGQPLGVVDKYWRVLTKSIDRSVDEIQDGTRITHGLWLFVAVLFLAIIGWSVDLLQLLTPRMSAFRFNSEGFEWKYSFSRRNRRVPWQNVRVFETDWMRSRFSMKAMKVLMARVEPYAKGSENLSIALDLSSTDIVIPVAEHDRMLELLRNWHEYARRIN